MVEAQILDINWNAAVGIAIKNIELVYTAKAEAHSLILELPRLQSHSCLGEEVSKNDGASMEVLYLTSSCLIAQ